MPSVSKVAVMSATSIATMISGTRAARSAAMISETSLVSMVSVPTTRSTFSIGMVIERTRLASSLNRSEKTGSPSRPRVTSSSSDSASAIGWRPVALTVSNVRLMARTVSSHVCSSQLGSRIGGMSLALMTSLISLVSATISRRGSCTIMRVASVSGMDVSWRMTLSISSSTGTSLVVALSVMKDEIS